jgi:hypothetical protein
MSFLGKKFLKKLLNAILLLVATAALFSCSCGRSVTEPGNSVQSDNVTHAIVSNEVKPVTSLSDEEVHAAVNGLDNYGVLHGDGDYFYIPVDQRYISRLFPQLKDRESLTNCFHKPTDLNGQAHISVHASGHGSLRQDELTLLNTLVKNKQMISFSLAANPIEIFIVHKHHHHKKQTNTWYVLRVNPNFDSLRKLYSSPTQLAALDQIKQYRFHISIAVQKKHQGRCIKPH